MGKNLISQRRGRGSLTYRVSSHRFQGEVKHPALNTVGTVTDILHCAGHSAPLLKVATHSGEIALAIAPEGVKVSDDIAFGAGNEIKEGNVLPLAEIPEGTAIHNIEIHVGDGGKMVRSSGVFARIIAKTEQGVHIKLPSKKEKIVNPACRAAIGIVAGSGRPEKPFMKAGTRFHRMAARNKLYPRVCGISMNAVDHPFGGKGSHTKGRPTQSPRNAPPGRKVGKIAPRRTGRRKL